MTIKDVFDLTYEDEPDKAYAKGWLEEDEIDWPVVLGAMGADPDKCGPTPFRHVYLAYLQTFSSRAEGWACEVREYSEPGRGRFKATLFEFDA